MCNSTAPVFLMANFKRISLILLGSVVAITISVLGLHLPSNILTVSAQEVTNTPEQIPQEQIQAQQTPLEQELTDTDQEQGEQPEECDKIFFGVWYIEEAKWEPENQAWSCCRYVDGEPDCPDPPET